MLQALNQLDQSMLFSTTIGLSCGFLNAVILAFFTSTASVAALWLLACAALLLDQKTRRCGLALLLAVTLAFMVGELTLKNTIMRDRPFVFYEVTDLLIKKPGSFSFPSGHAASSFASLTVLYTMCRRMRIPAAIYALMISFSRVYLFVHYPSDVLAGALLGIASGYLVMALMNRLAPQNVRLSIRLHAS